MQLKSLLLITLLSGFVSSCATPAKPPASTPATLSFELPDLSGRTVRLNDYAGKVVLVDLWATWCRPCEASMPFYASLEQKYGARGFKVVAISVDERDEDVTAFLQGRALPFQILRDPSGKVPSSLAIETMPTAFLVGRDGAVIKVHPGFVAGDEEQIERAVVEALDARAPVATSTSAP